MTNYREGAHLAIKTINVDQDGEKYVSIYVVDHAISSNLKKMNWKTGSVSPSQFSQS